jgi:hypothetical protein
MKAAVASMPWRDWLLKKPAWLDHQTEVGQDIRGIIAAPARRGGGLGNQPHRRSQRTQSAATGGPGSCVPLPNHCADGAKVGAVPDIDPEDGSRAIVARCEDVREPCI